MVVLEIELSLVRALSMALWRERSGSAVELRPKGRGFEPQRRHCVVVLDQDTFILA